VDLGWDDPGHRSRPGHDRKGFCGVCGPGRGQATGRLSPPRRRPVAVLGTAGAGAQSDRIQRALAYAKRNLHPPLTVRQLAEAAHPSPRQFSRAFRTETGQSPAKAVENLRVEAARLMEQSRHPIDGIARQTGFADRDRMRRAFLRAFGQPPQVIRRNARAALAA